MEKKNRFSDAEAAKLLLVLADRSEKKSNNALKKNKRPKKKIVLSKQTRHDLEKIIAESEEK